ncbi:hypothetical protein P43SY_004941 [Pythium insidiosum]|uniref:Protein-S-isoprenylcysteine O-methyltransferase n=1 Tax=Pythium insidiosum TaxID=114742 RepID=A0AAD5LC02_PYTIN|nr:hypothetical protein P43SY_004941 [Pythium insidiosum]KAJ0396665.1 hypothetical protein ATCC90586_009966 [Pythium insidiosum]
MFRSTQFTSDVGLGRVAVAAFALGFVLALHLALLVYVLAAVGVTQSDTWACVAVWCVYAVALCFFHLAEFMVTASFKPSIVSYESFLLNHSKEYHAALLASALEFAVETLLAPGFKVTAWSLVLGLALVVGGQVVRIAAMWTAASNFSHRIEYVKRKDHVLVKHGIYKFVRHPSYMGWFWWTVGSQVLLANPVCALGFAAVSWSFFRDRIPYEEDLLLQFFPDEYPSYRRSTFSGVPFVA